MSDSAVPQGKSPPASQSSKNSALPKKLGGKKVQQIGDFKILKKLGQGGMGAVYLAHQVSLDRKCALKVMSRELAKREDFVTRFIREARVMAKIEHPNVVKSYAVGDHQGMYYVAMEYIDGASMQDWIQTLKKLSVGDALHIGIVCAQALSHAHKMNLIHRDIKPDNILITKNGAVKVADLGLAKALDEDQSMTQSGTGLGTPLYMPPEQARNAKYVDQRSDIYAIGCMLYKFLCGNPPFKAESTLELILAKEKGKFTPLARLNKEVPEKLDLMIDKMIAKNPDLRYQNCDDLLVDLMGLGLENQSLSFIDAEEKVTLGGGSLASGQTSLPRTSSAPKPKSRDVPRTSREEARRQKIEAAKADKGVWHVKFKDRTGKVQVQKMSTDQIHRGLGNKLLDENTQLTKNSKVNMVRISSVPEFKDQVREILHSRQEGKKKEDMQSLYNKLDKQHQRRKWWRVLDNIRDGTLGWLSLMIWLGVVAAVGYGFYLGVPLVWQMIADNFGLTS